MPNRRLIRGADPLRAGLETGADAAFSSILRQAGAVMTYRGGRSAAAHYGSAAGELAVCVQGVGLAHRPDLAVSSLRGPEEDLDQLLARVLGHEVAPGGTAFEAGAWWCRSASRSEILVVSRRVSIARVTGLLRLTVDGLGITNLLEEESQKRQVFNIVGRRAEQVLADLGVLGTSADIRNAAPFSEVQVRGHEVLLLLEASVGALAIVDPSSATDIWHAIDEAGRPHGISCVGLDAIERYALMQRAQHRTLGLL